MSIPVVCPNCSAKLNAPDSAAGKRVKCPKCQTGMVVPEALPEASPFEVVDEPLPAAKLAAKPAAKPKIIAKALVEGEDDDDDRPRKRRRDDEDDDDDDQPRKKKKKAAADNSMLIRNAVGGVLLVALLGVAGYIFYDRAQKAKEEEAAGNSNAGRTETPPGEVPLPGAPIGTGGGPRPKGPGPGVNPEGKKPIGTPGQPTTLASPKGFKVTFPGPYVVDELPPRVRNTIGLPIAFYASEDRANDRVYLAAAIDFPADYAADEKERARGRVIRSLNEDAPAGAKPESRNVTAGGRTWEELTLLSNGERGAIIRLLQTDARLFVVGVGGRKVPTPDEAKKFFDTFALTAAGTSGSGASGRPATGPGGEPDFSLAASDFRAEIKKNVQAASAKYAGKWVEVSGTVSFVGDYSDEKRVRTLGLVSGVQDADPIYCDVPQPDRAPGKYSLGQAVRVKALVGPVHLNSLRLTEGEVLELGPSRALKVTAEELGKEYAADPAAAEKKYARKTLLLSGIVAELKPDSFDRARPNVVLKTVPGINLVCETNFKLSPATQKVKPGNAVTFSGFVMSFSRSDKKLTFYNFELVAD